MGSYTGIADVSRSILELLRNKCAPEPIKKAETIGLCAPNDRGNNILGLYLYNIEENPESYSQKKIVLDKEHFKDAPISFNLYYMIYAFSESEVNAKLIDEQRILGKAIQVLNDYKRVPSEYLMGTFAESNEIIELQSIMMPVDDRVKVWSLFNLPYHISYFYKVGPIFMESDVIRSVKRVTSADISVTQK